MIPNETTREQVFIADLVKSLLADVRRAQTNLIESQNKPEERFDAGVVQGYWQVFSSLISRMQIYELDLAQYGLEGFETDDIWIQIRESFAAKKKTLGDENPL